MLSWPPPVLAMPPDPVRIVLSTIGAPVTETVVAVGPAVFNDVTVNVCVFVDELASVPDTPSDVPLMV